MRGNDLGFCCYTAKPLSDHGSRQYGIVTKKQFFEHSGQDVEHFADDKNTGSGVVISRAVNTLRSDETHPCNRFARRVRTMTINKAEAPDDDCSVDFDDMKRENCKLSSSPTIYGDWTNSD
ncbi:conserved hypothetical protein [Trichinella spiralis]|uniref:hypothetical protein n=1 Tax=Trichinella spiralis TaxID=6334 RepID=UPI0001EFE85B|nr:conserved hypothetical protein [Trichinella spiralis]